MKEGKSITERQRGNHKIEGEKQQERDYQRGKGCVRENAGKTEKESVQDRKHLGHGGER